MLRVKRPGLGRLKLTRRAVCSRPEVLVTLSSDIGKILTALHQIKIGGSATLSTAVQIAQVGMRRVSNVEGFGPTRCSSQI